MAHWGGGAVGAKKQSEQIINRAGYTFVCDIFTENSKRYFYSLRSTVYRAHCYSNKYSYVTFITE